MTRELFPAPAVPTTKITGGWVESLAIVTRKRVSLSTLSLLQKNIKINKAIGINEDSTSEIKKSNLEIKNLFSKLGIFLLS